ncbi:MAG: ELWxxDGT repeat protein [Planctomycetaceae bacterium]
MNGYELWQSDGTAVGTTLVKDIFSGRGNSSPRSLANVNGTLFFSAFDSVSGIELWQSDGTSVGTTLVKDIVPGSDSSYPYSLTNVNGTLFFSADNSLNGSELWQSDGTSAGTKLVKDIRTGIGSSSPKSLTNLNGTLFFSTNDGTNGDELWKADIPADTPKVAVHAFNFLPPAILKDIVSGNSGSNLSNFVNVNGTLFFQANDGTNGPELWKTDGTSAGTTLVKDIHSGSTGSSPRALTNVNGTLFFSANDGASGYEIWKSDGTATGTTRIKDICSGISSSYPVLLTNVNGTLFFIAFDDVNGNELWRSDGTSAGTMLVKDIRNGSSGSLPRYLTNVNGTLFFSANDGTHGYELWQSDGTSAGTILVKDITSGGAGSNPVFLTNLNGTLLFRAFDNTSGYELWKSNGTFAGTTLAKDIRSGSSGSSPGSLTNVNGTLYFNANDGVHGNELWLSDGTSVGTTLVKDARTGSGSSYPTFLTNVNGTVFFAADDRTNGAELWESDGTSVGTTLVKDIRSGNSSSSPYYLTNVNGTLFFTANDGANGVELWESDGTSAGTTLVKDVRSGSSGSDPGFLTNMNGTLFFAADDGVNGLELWSMLKNSRPQLTAFAAVVDTTNEDTEVELTFAEFKAQGDESDVDGTVDSFVVQAVSSGTLKIGASALTATPFVVGSNDKINSTHNVYWTPAGNSHGSAIAALTVLAQDNNGLTSTLPITANVRVSAVADTPSVANAATNEDVQSPSGLVISRNVADGAEVTHFKITNITGGSLFQNDGITAISDNEFITFDQASVGLRFTPALNSNVTGHFTVQASLSNVNSGLGGSTVTANITVTPVNDPASALVLTPSSANLAEDAGTSTARTLTTITVADDPQGSNVLSLTGANAASFEIVSGELRLKSGVVLDSETQRTYTVRVEVDDAAVGGSPDASATFTLNIIDVNEAPAAVAFQNTTMSLAENTSTASAIKLADVVVTDDALGTNVLLLRGPDAAFFELRNNELLLKAGTVLDFETKSNYNVTVEANDPEVGSTPDAFTAFILTIENLVDVTRSSDAFVFTYSAVTVDVTHATNGGVPSLVGSFLLTSSITLDGLAADDSVRVVGTSGDDVILVQRTGLAINGAGLILNGFPQITLAGEAGSDTYTFDSDSSLSNYTLIDSSGTGDTISLAPTSSLPVTLDLAQTIAQSVNANLILILGSATDFEDAIGGDQDDVLLGNGLANRLTGNGGRDRLNGRGGSDELNGGSSDDTYLFGLATSLEADTVTEATNGGTDTLDFSVQTTSVSAYLNLTSVQTVHTNRTLKLNSHSTLENLIGGYGSDLLVGNGLNNTLAGGAGNDTLNGTTGSDMLIGGLNNDIYSFGTSSVGEADRVVENTGEGLDTLSFATHTTAVTVYLNVATVQPVHSNRTLQLNSHSTIENLIGSSGADLLVGNTLNNTLTGGAGDDILNGTTGSDTLIGGQNNDTYTFGAATVGEADQVIENANEGVDTLSFANMTSAVTVSLSSTAVQSVHTDRTLKLNSGATIENAAGGFGNDRLTGNALANRLNGGHGNNILIGLDGSDVLEAGNGRDILIGGRGADTLTGGGGDDILIAGRTLLDTDAASLSTVQTEWLSGNNYATRVANLKAGVGSPVVSLQPTVNVLNDAAQVDSLTGGTALDWYFRAIDDTITDLFAGEIIEGL